MGHIAIIDGLPIYGDRVNINNIILNDIISYKIKGNWVFSMIIGNTPTMIKVVDLRCEITEDGVYLFTNSKQNETTKCLLSPSRRIFKIKNIKQL